MALTWERSHETDSTGTIGTASYDAASKLYQVVRSYDVDAEIAAAICDTSAPGSFDITHTDASTVTMQPVARDARRIAIGKSIVTITYEGHVLGLVSVNIKAQGKSKKLIYSLDEEPAGFGPNQEGVNVIEPHTTVVVRRNLTKTGVLYSAASYLSDTARMVGTVNESAWLSQALDWAEPVGWKEGAFLFLGFEMTENRDGTLTTDHYFAYDSSAEGDHKYRYREVKFSLDDSSGQNRQKMESVGPEITRKMYGIAGTDTDLTFGSSQL